MEEEKIDKLLYSTEDVQLFHIPPPSKANGYKHNISLWNLDQPIWEGTLEVHEIEKFDDTASVNPFDRPHKPRGDPRTYFKLELRFINPDGSTFATVPRLLTLCLDDLSIVPTDSSRIYAVFPEVTSDVFLEVESIRMCEKDDVNLNSTIKRIGLGMRFPSSYDASNFNIYLREFEADYKIYEEVFLLEKRQDDKTQNIDSVEEHMAILEEKFYDIRMEDERSSFQSEDDDSDDFGEFTGVE